MEKQEIKDAAKFLIDLCEGDFALIFKTEDMKEYFDGVSNDDFMVALSDVDKRSWKHPEYFFKNFGTSKQYIKLD